MGALFSFGLPTMEIASGKEPVAVIFTASRKFVVRRIKPQERYFILNDKNVRGVYEMDSNLVYFYEKTPVYFYDYRNAKPMDPVIVNELNRWADKNNLAKIERKDVRQGSLLRRFRGNKETEHKAYELAVADGTNLVEQTDTSINEFFQMFNEQQKKEQIAKVEPMIKTNEDLAYHLTQYLKDKNLLSPEEAMLLDERIRSKNISVDEMIGELRNRDFLNINEPISLNCQRFLDSYHTYEPARLFSFSNRVPWIDKKLKTMTSIPIKNWIPASLVIALFIGASIGVIVLIQNWGMIQDALKHIMPGSTPHIIKYLISQFK